MNGRLLSGSGGEGYSRRHKNTREYTQKISRSLLGSEYRMPGGRVRHEAGDVDGIQAVKGFIPLASGNYWRF